MGEISKQKKRQEKKQRSNEAEGTEKVASKSGAGIRGISSITDSAAPGAAVAEKEE